MKLRSIILAGLIGTSLLTMSGCNEDDVEKVINDILNTSYITIANAANTQDFEVQGTLSSDTSVVENGTKFFAVTDHSDYTVSTSGGTVSDTFHKDGGYLFGLCSNGAHAVSDSSDGHRIGVVNLDSDHNITNQKIEFSFSNGDANVSATVSVGACAKTIVPAFDNINTSVVNGLTVNGKSYSLMPLTPELEDAFEALEGRAEVDLVVFDVHNNIGTAIPIVKPK